MEDLERRLAALKGIPVVAPEASRMSLPAAAQTDEEQIEQLLQMNADQVQLEMGRSPSVQPILPAAAAAGGSGGVFDDATPLDALKDAAHHAAQELTKSDASHPSLGRGGKLREEMRAAMADANAVLRAERQAIADGRQKCASSGDDDDLDEEAEALRVLQELQLATDLDESVTQSHASASSATTSAVDPAEVVLFPSAPKHKHVSCKADAKSISLPPARCAAPIPDDDPERWCCICNADAVLWCVDCDHDAYCRRCFNEGHNDDEDLRAHRVVPFDSAKR